MVASINKGSMMNIYQCEDKAKVDGFDSVTFGLLNTLTGDVLKCKWVDAHKGLIKFEGTEGVIPSKFIANCGLQLVCIDYEVPQ